MTGNRREWIAERTLRVGTGRGRISVRLEKPRQLSDQEWTSRVEIRKGKTKAILDRDVSGADAFQSLMIALDVIRDELDKLPGPITWEDQAPGDVGFPRFVTPVFGFEFQRRLESILETQTKRRFAQIERRMRRSEGAGVIAAEKAKKKR